MQSHSYSLSMTGRSRRLVFETSGEGPTSESSFLRHPERKPLESKDLREAISSPPLRERPTLPPLHSRLFPFPHGKGLGVRFPRDALISPLTYSPASRVAPTRSNRE